VVAVSFCGVALAFALFAIPELQPARPVSLMVLGPFIGAAMSITAFPVLARILTEWDMHKTAPGALALTCAAMEDFLG
jgi:Kef-type K+ transport system membrane component KefB